MSWILTRRSLTACLVLGLCGLTLAQEPNKPSAGRYTPTFKEPRSPASIEKYLQYYLGLYNDNLKSPDWMARAMGVISLAKIREPRMTDRLLTVLRKDESPLVKLFAWEALHARQDKLDANARAEWVKAGLALGDGGHFRGEMRAFYIQLVGEGGPTPENKARFLRTFETTNSMHPGDVRTLWAMAEVLKEWQSPDIVRDLIGTMGKLDAAYRAEMVLMQMGSSASPCSLYASEGSAAMWAKTQQAWNDWLQKADLKEIDPAKAQKWMDTNAYLPAGEALEDTSDPKWRGDLELPKFRLGQLDVGICLDATGSMTPPMDWVKQDVIRMMKMFELISKEPRIGVTLYRDKGDAYVAKSVPLSSEAAGLAAALRKEAAHGGGDIPEAILEGLTETVKNQNWSGESAKKIVVLIGDAPPHEETLKQIQELVTESVKSGFVFYAVKVQADHRAEEAHGYKDYDPQLETFDKIARWGDGNSLWVDFEKHVLRPQSTNCAQPMSEDSPQRLIFSQILTAALHKGYADRVGPFVRVLLEYVDETPKEVRLPFPKAPSPPPAGTGTGPRPRPRPQPPRDPQAR